MRNWTHPTLFPSNCIIPIAYSHVPRTYRRYKRYVEHSLLGWQACESAQQTRFAKRCSMNRKAPFPDAHVPDYAHVRSHTPSNRKYLLH